MTTLIYILFFVIIIISIINNAIIVLRQKTYNNMDILYDKMEIFVIKNKLTPDNELLNFLKSFKNLTINKDFADIYVLLTIIQSLPNGDFENNRKKYENYIKTLPIELVRIANEFNNQVSIAISISVFKPDFLWFFSKIFLKHSFISLKNRSYKKIKNLTTNVRYVFHYENLLASYPSLN